MKMTHSQSEDDYDQLVDRMKVVAPTEFMAYYRENWGNCANMWVDFHRKKTRSSWEQNNELVGKLPPEDQGSLTTQHDSGRVHHPVDEVAPWQEIRN